MIELTEEQQREVAKTAVPRVLDPLSRKTYVLIGEEAYARLQALLSNDIVYTTAEMLDRAMADDDANDPYLAQLQKKYGDASA